MKTSSDKVIANQALLDITHRKSNRCSPSEGHLKVSMYQKNLRTSTPSDLVIPFLGIYLNGKISVNTKMSLYTSSYNIVTIL